MTFRVLLALIVAGCTSFENPDVVVDLRPIAMTAEPPEQLVTLDPRDPPPPAQLLQQLVPTRVCGLLSDREHERALRYEVRICISGSRCGDGPQTVIASGVIDDPDTTSPAPELCAIVEPNGNLLGILLELLEGDAFSGLGGLDYNVQLRFGGVDEDPALDQFMSKHVRVAPRFPSGRTPNQNPSLRRLEASIENADRVGLSIGRCLDQPEPLAVRRGQRVKIEPIEADDAREPYLTPTLDGQGAMFTETLTYQWTVTAGSLLNGTTGGTTDPFGNMPPIATEWRAPTDLSAPLDVDIHIVQRDERLGAQWYQTCLRVLP